MGDLSLPSNFKILFEGATSQWQTENSAAKQRGITLSGMTLWQTQCPWWTQCPSHSLSPLSSVPLSRSCWTAHRHGDIATERLKSEKNHAFIFILVPIFKYPVNWPTLMASGIAGGRKQFFLRSSKTNVPGGWFRNPSRWELIAPTNSPYALNVALLLSCG